MHRLKQKTDEGEGGFTIVEMVIAITLLSLSLLFLARLLFGSIGALGAVQQRSEMTQRATAVVEALRSRPYDEVCATNADLGAYPGGAYDGYDAVVGTTCPPAATTVPADDTTVAHTIRRWITWTDASGATTHRLKRLTVLVEWQENGRSQRRVQLQSLLYPGGLGVDEGANTAPTAVVAASASNVVAGSPVTFDGSGSSDPDVGDALSYTWDFGDGSTPITASSTIDHVYATSGAYTTQLKVTDAAGAFAVDSVDVTVAPPGTTNQAPTAVAFEVDPINPKVAPFPVSVDGSGSSDPDGDTLAYSWDWGDGSPPSPGVAASHTYTSGGTFTITLTVTDTSGLTGTDSLEVVLVPLDCDVLGGSFTNPPSSVANYIKVAGNRKPQSGTFSFTATSNVACSSMSARLPYSGGTLVVALAKGSTTNGTTAWSGTGSVGNNVRFNTGNAQTYAFWSPADSGAAEKLSVTFSVHQ